MLLRKSSLEIYADYFQFYLKDLGVHTEVPTEYDEETHNQRIHTSPSVVVIKPARRATVPVEIEIHDSEPPCDIAEWDHVVEASLHLPTGQLGVEECLGEMLATFTIGPGWYRVRSFHRGLGTIERLEGDDFYLVVMWPNPPGDVVVLKQWTRT